MADEMTVNEQELVRHIETLQNKVEELEGLLAMRDAEIDSKENRITELEDEVSSLGDVVWDREKEIKNLKDELEEQ